MANVALMQAMAQPKTADQYDQYLKLQKQILLAQAMADQKDLPTESVGGVAIQRSPFESLSNAIKPIVGGYIQGKMLDSQGDLVKQNLEAQKALWTGSASDPSVASQAALMQGGMQGDVGPTVGNANLMEAMKSGTAKPMMSITGDPQKDWQLAQFFPEEAAKAAFENFKPTDKMKNDRYMGLDPKQSKSLYVNEAAKSVLDNAMQAGFDENGNLIAKPVQGATDLIKGREQAKQDAGFTTTMVDGREQPVPNSYLRNQFNQQYGGQQPQADSFSGAMQMLHDNEGGLTTSDGATNAPAIYGINAKYWPNEFAEAKRITDTQGEQAGKQYADGFYKKNFWDKYGIENLPPQTQKIVFDGVVNQTGIAPKLVQAAQQGATPEQLIQMRRNYYQQVAQQPNQAGNLQGWNNRLDKFVTQPAPPVIGKNPVEQETQTVANKDFIEKSYRPVLDEAKAARTSNFQLDVLDKLPVSEKTGWGQDAVATAANVLVGMGYDGEQAKALASDAQVFNNIVNQQNWNLLQAQKGPQTEGDASRAMKTLSSLGNTPEANQFNRDLARALNNRKVQQAQFYSSNMPKYKGDLTKMEADWDTKATSIWDDPVMKKWVSGGGVAGGKINLKNLPAPPGVSGEKWDEYMKLKGAE